MSERLGPDDPYQLTEAAVLEPPTSLFGRLKYLGPGLILSASIVGSGELIATTALGAKAGFVCLWVILVSCLVKVALQLEFGKHTISSGETTMEALNSLPGPRIGKAGWPIWTWLGLMFFKFLQVGGILGLSAMAAHMVFPAVAQNVWVFVLAILVALLVFTGRYALIEKTCITLIGIFTLLVFIALGKVIGLGEAPPLSAETAVHLPNVLSGLTFNPAVLEGAILGVAIAAFGITGVGGDEIMHYNYWLLEKGYASKTGARPKGGGSDWTRRARGWIGIMHLDALLSMVVYTVMTVAFYLLGASLLRGSGDDIGEGVKLLENLSAMFTETFGPGARLVFLGGAFMVLFSTLLAALGALSRTYADAFSQLGLYNFRNPAHRSRWIAILSFVIPTIWAAAFFLFKEPKAMILLGGAATSVMLLIVVAAAIYFHFKRIPGELAPKIFYRVAFWVSVIAILTLSLKVAVETALKLST